MILEIKELNKHYGDKHVLKDVSFSIEAGKPLGLLGRNGHGKSTTMKIIMNIISSDSGEVLLNGQPIDKKKYKLGYLPEERGLYQKINILDQIIYFGKLRGLSSSKAKKSAIELIEKLEMQEYLKQKANALSKGNQQKIQLAIAMINDPDIIILDEPYSGLDPVNAKSLQNIIEESSNKDKLILFSSHQLNTVEEFCEDICIINRGEVLLSGNLKEIKNNYPVEKMLVVPVQGNETALTNLLNEEKIRYEQTEKGIVLDKTSNQNVLKNIIRNMEIESFSYIRPTLLEIFLKQIGEENE